MKRIREIKGKGKEKLSQSDNPEASGESKRRSSRSKLHSFFSFSAGTKKGESSVMLGMVPACDSLPECPLVNKKPKNSAAEIYVREYKAALSDVDADSKEREGVRQKARTNDPVIDYLFFQSLKIRYEGSAFEDYTKVNKGGHSCEEACDTEAFKAASAAASVAPKKKRADTFAAEYCSKKLNHPKKYLSEAFGDDFLSSHNSNSDRLSKSSPGR